MNIYISTYPLPSRSEYLFTLHKSVVQKLSDMWRSTFKIGTAQLRSVTKMATQSLCYYMWTESLSGMIFAQVKQRGEVWRRVTMVALFLDDNKTNDDGEGEENGKKKMFINNKQQLCTCITLFCTFLCRRLTTTTWDFLISRARFIE